VDADPTTPTPLDLGAPDDAAIGAQVQREAEALHEFPSQRPPIVTRVRNLASELPREGDATREAELDRLALAWHEARGAAALKAEAAFRMASGGDPRGPGHVYWRMLDRVTRLHPGCDPAGVCGEDAHDLPAPLRATEGSSAARDAEPHGHLPPWTAFPRGPANPEAVLADMRALSPADRARVLASLRESDARRERDELVARMRTLADNARNAAQSLCVPDYGFPGIVSQETAGIVRALRALAETTDRAAESASKAGA